MFRLAGVLLAAGSLGVVALVQPHHTVAIQETGFTLPFYARSNVACDYGVSYASCGAPQFPGNHNGIDYNVGQNSTVGEVIASAAGGTARGCTFQSDGAGWWAMIDHGGGIISLYYHMNQQALPPGSGADVARGEIIGYEGSTGKSTGPHLHFETHTNAGAPNCATAQGAGTITNPHSLWQDNPPNNADVSPAVSAPSSGSVSVVVRGKNNSLYVNGSQPLGTQCLKSAPSATGWNTSRLDIFWRGCSNNDLYYAKRVNGVWSAPLRPLPGQCLLAAPAATSWTNRIDVFFRGCDNDLWQVSWTSSGGWVGGWKPVPGQCLLAAPGAISPATSKWNVVFRGCNDAIFQYSYNGGWSGSSLGGCTQTGPSIASWASNRLDVFYRGCESSPAGAGIFTRSWNGSAWQAEQNLWGCTASGSGSGGWAPDQLSVYFRGCSSPATIWKFAWNGGGWTQTYHSNWP